MRSVLTALLGAALAASCTSLPVPEQPGRHTHADPTRVKSAMQAAVVPTVKLEKMPVSDAIAWWSEWGLVHNGNRGISVIAKPEGTATVTIRGTNMSLLTLLNSICKQADLVWWIDPKCVVIVPRDKVSRSGSDD